jgi:hypothetical protein
MASQAPANQLPLLYKDLIPVSSNVHGNFKARTVDGAPFLKNVHAIPLTSDELVMAQRFYPIVFSLGENPVPLALMGLNEGVNVFIDEDGKPRGEIYIPAYVRRYPFLLARLRPEADELSLCVDPTSDIIGEFDEGAPLFDGEKPSEATNTILKFCEDFEIAAQRTNAFMAELKQADLLIDGEVSITPNNGEPPFIYRGFQMVSEEKFRELRGDELRRMNQNGMLPLVIAHLFSLPLIREVFARQMGQGQIAQGELVVNG